MSKTTTPLLKKKESTIQAKKQQQKKNEAARRSRKSNLSAVQQEAQMKARLETQHAYHDAIEDLFEQQEDVARELALKFNKSLSTVLQDVQHRGKLTHRRDVNSYNAWNHFKKMDLLVDDLDITEDERNLLLELQDVEDEGYEKFKLLPDKLYNLVIDELVLYREHQMKGSRMTARARGQDIRFSSERIVAELEALNARCSTMSFLFIVRTDRSHVHVPFHWAHPKAQAYIETVLKRDIHDLAFEFEAFTLSEIQEVAKNANARRVQLKSKIREAIRLGLEEITGIQGINMEWTRYEARIVDVHKVAITGWPKKISFTCELATTSLNVVLTAVLEGTCKWKKLTEHEYSQHVRKREATTDNRSCSVDTSKDSSKNACSSESSSAEGDHKDTPSCGLFLPSTMRTTVEPLDWPVIDNFYPENVVDVGNLTLMENFSAHNTIIRP